MNQGLSRVVFNPPSPPRFHRFPERVRVLIGRLKLFHGVCLPLSESGHFV